MSFFKDMWAVIAAAVMAWFSRIDNNALNKVVNLLTILVITIGLLDWAIRKLNGRAKKKKEKKLEKRQVLDSIENTQKPFRVVNMLDNPMETSEKIGNIFDKIIKNLGGENMKKIFKWIWYNKEQLLSIGYNVVVIVLTNFLMWTDILNGFFEGFVGAQGILIIKVAALVLSLMFTALTVRNICVKHGVSSLTTIDAYLEEKAKIKASKLTPEQKKTLKGYINSLQSALATAKNELSTAEASLAEITALFNADNSLVRDYAARKADFEKTINYKKGVVESIESKIAEYKSQLDGKQKA